MTRRTLLASATLCFALACPAFAGGHGSHHQNLGRALKGGNFNVADEQIFQSIAKDERSQLFTDTNVAKSKSLLHHSNQVIWANSGPDCLVAPVQASGTVANGNASKPKDIFHRNNQVTWTNSGPDCLVAPVQTSESINGGNASKSPRHEKWNGRGR